MCHITDLLPVLLHVAMALNPSRQHMPCIPCFNAEPLAQVGLMAFSAAANSKLICALQRSCCSVWGPPDSLASGVCHGHDGGLCRTWPEGALLALP